MGISDKPTIFWWYMKGKWSGLLKTTQYVMLMLVIYGDMVFLTQRVEKNFAKSVKIFHKVVPPQL